MVSKTTTTLLEILESELAHAGLNEFYDCKTDNLTLTRNENAFIQKIIAYDSDVEKIVNNLFFSNITLEKPEYDKPFKRAFITHFLHREIKFQTVELFRTQVVYTMFLQLDFLNEYYRNLENYLQQKNESSNTNETDTRQLFTTLPQDVLNMNVENDIMEYADNNTIGKTKTQGNNTANKADIDNLLKFKNILESIFSDFDKRCFLQVW